MPVPVILKAYFDDGTNEIVYNESAIIWKEGNKDIQISFTTNKKVKKVELGTTQIPDADNSNNTSNIK